MNNSQQLTEEELDEMCCNEEMCKGVKKCSVQQIH